MGASDRWREVPRKIHGNHGRCCGVVRDGLAYVIGKLMSAVLLTKSPIDIFVEGRLTGVVYKIHLLPASVQFDTLVAI